MSMMCVQKARKFAFYSYLNGKHCYSGSSQNHILEVCGKVNELNVFNFKLHSASHKPFTCLVGNL